MTGLYNTAPSSPPPPLQLAQNNSPAILFYDHSSTVDGSQQFSSQRVGHWFDPDGNSSMLGSKGAVRVRRRPPPGSDHVKHRRTRSGCYTCRTRRVKVRWFLGQYLLSRIHLTLASAMRQVRSANVSLQVFQIKSTWGSNISQVARKATENVSTQNPRLQKPPAAAPRVVEIERLYREVVHHLASLMTKMWKAWRPLWMTRSAVVMSKTLIYLVQ